LTTPRPYSKLDAVHGREGHAGLTRRYRRPAHLVVQGRGRAHLAGRPRPGGGPPARAHLPLPTLAVGDVSTAEGTAAAPGKLSFPVTLSKASKKTVTVAYTNADGTATTPADYAAASGTLTFAPGETQKMVDVELVGDLAVEPDETLTVKLSQPANALLPNDTATGAITNDDVAPKPAAPATTRRRSA
jgi:Calx-beta domain-containing protein